ncbi:hypothetical protein EDC04DRAFT_2538566, partial [Pisolithus marmoratus]
LHCDPHSSGNWYDITANVGDHSSCIMSIPTLGVELVYDPGMVVAFSRHLLRHGVNAVDGNWHCLTYYMRDNIH